MILQEKLAPVSLLL